MKTITDELTQNLVYKKENESIVVRGKGYVQEIQGTVCCSVTDTGNGFIVKFPAHNCTTQDYYVCLDYTQARDMVIGLAEFKKDLGFKDE
jgi:hypothetical protein